MAKVEFKDIDKVSRNLQKRFTRFTNDPVEMQKVAKTLRNEQVFNLRAGLGSDDNPLPSLKASTINQRGRLAEFNRTAARYSQFFSNVTFSGQFVRSLVVTWKKKIASAASFEYQYRGVHKGYKNQDGTRSTAVDNSDIFEGLSSRGWKLAGVTNRAQERIRKQFIRFIRRK